MIKKHSFIHFVTLFLFSMILFACKTTPVVEPEPEPVPEPVYKEPSIYIADAGVFTASELASFFLSKNPDYPEDEILEMAETYIMECATEGINWDIAFAQMCLETGYLRFGNLVSPEMHNYCGLGAIDAEHRGEVFETMELGVRAHVQHLHAYGTTEEYTLVNELIDKRYKWVNPRGKAPTFYELAGTWAADRAYGDKLESILQNITLAQTGM